MVKSISKGERDRERERWVDGGREAVRDRSGKTARGFKLQDINVDHSCQVQQTIPKFRCICKSRFSKLTNDGKAMCESHIHETIM